MKTSIRTIGGFSVTNGDDEIVIAGTKPRAILAYLAVHAPEPVNRGILATLLWDRSGDRQARQSLRVALSDLRGAIGKDMLLAPSRDQIALDPENVDIDLLRMRGLATSLKIEDLLGIEPELGRSFLAGVESDSQAFEDWLVEARREYAEFAIGVMKRLGRILIADGRAREAIEPARKAVRLDPFDEECRSLEIDTLIAAGHKAQALRAEQEADQFFRDELGSGFRHDVGNEDVAEQTRGLRDRRIVSILDYGLDDVPLAARRADLDRYCDLAAQVGVIADTEIEAVNGIAIAVTPTGGAALFGDVVSGEETARIAVETGLRIRDRLAAETSGKVQDVSLRIGVASGVAVVDPVSLTDRVMVASPATTQAALARKAAENGTLLVDAATRALLGRYFHLERDSAVHGGNTFWIAEHHSAEPASRFNATRSLDTPYCGREMELAEGHLRREAVLGGEGQVLLITGEAGIGKSRLAMELCGSGPRRDMWILQCDPNADGETLHPLSRLRASRAFARLPEEDCEDRALMRFALGIRHKPPIALKNLDTAMVRERTFGALITALRQRASRRPLTVIVEDAHWADRFSRDLLEMLFDVVAGLPVFLIVTSRIDDFSQWSGESHVSRLSLSRLPEATSRHIAEQVWRSEGLEMQNFEPVWQAASAGEGIPFFIEEQIRWRANRVRAGLPVHALEVSPNISSTFAGRFAALGEAALPLKAAAAIGRPFSRHLLEAALGEDGAAIDLDAALDTLRKARILRWSTERWLPVYAFQHMLFQDFARDLMLEEQASAMHGRILDALEADMPDVEWTPASALARHAEKAGRICDAIDRYHSVAQSGLLRSDTADARLQLETALDLCSTLPDGEAKVLRELMAIRLLGPLLCNEEGTASPRVRSLYARGVALSRARPAHETDNWFAIYWGWWFTGHTFPEQQKRARTIIEQTSGTTDDEIRLQALHCSWAIDFNLGEHSHAVAAIEKGLPLYNHRKAADITSHYGGHDSRICGLGMQALSGWFLGRSQESAAAETAMLTHARKLAHPPSQGHAMVSAALLAAIRGDRERTGSYARDLHEIGEQHGYPILRAKARIYDGFARSGDDAARAAEMVADGVAELQDVSTRDDFPFFLGLQAECALIMGDEAGTCRALDAALAEIDADGRHYWIAELLRLRARLLILSGDHEAALSVLRRGLHVAKAQDAHELVMRLMTTAGKVKGGLDALDMGDGRRHHRGHTRKGG